MFHMINYLNPHQKNCVSKYYYIPILMIYSYFYLFIFVFMSACAL